MANVSGFAVVRLGNVPRFGLSALSVYAGLYLPMIWLTSPYGRYEVAVLLLTMVGGGVMGLGWWFRKRGTPRALATELAFSEMGRAIISGGIFAVAAGLFGG